VTPVPAIEKSGPAQFFTANVTSPRRLTVVPEIRDSAKVFPAGTVNAEILIWSEGLVSHSIT